MRIPSQSEWPRRHHWPLWPHRPHSLTSTAPPATLTGAPPSRPPNISPHSTLSFTHHKSAYRQRTCLICLPMNFNRWRTQGRQIHNKRVLAWVGRPGQGAWLARRAGWCGGDVRLSAAACCGIGLGGRGGIYTHKNVLFSPENLATAGRIRLKDHTNCLNKHNKPLS